MRRTSFLWASVLLLAGISMLPAISTAQNPPAQSLPDAPSAQKQKNSQQGEGRILGLAQYNVVSAGNAAPLIPNQKWRLFVRQGFDPFTFVGAALTAGLEQASNDFPGYGQGTAGYVKRFGAATADSIDSSFWGGFVFPVMFKEDPRYFRLGHGSMTHRIGYAISRVLVTQTDSGHRGFNFANILGIFAAGGIANAYYPAPDRGLGLTLRRAGVVTALDALSKIGEEFLPDINQRIRRKKNRSADGN